MGWVAPSSLLLMALARHAPHPGDGWCGAPYWSLMSSRGVSGRLRIREGLFFPERGRLLVARERSRARLAASRDALMNSAWGLSLRCCSLAAHRPVDRWSSRTPPPLSRGSRPPSTCPHEPSGGRRFSSRLKASSSLTPPSTRVPGRPRREQVLPRGPGIAGPVAGFRRAEDRRGR